MPQADTPQGAPRPDCRTPGGCLFCEHNRDIASFDHVWQLASQRALALHELAADRTAQGRDEDHPRNAEIKRIAAKFEEFAKRGGRWPKWLAEADRRVASEHYHTLHVEQWEAIRGNAE